MPYNDAITNLAKSKNTMYLSTFNGKVVQSFYIATFLCIIQFIVNFTLRVSSKLEAYSSKNQQLSVIPKGLYNL